METLMGLNRRIADRLAPFLARSPLKPNHVTTLALLSGVASGCLMSRGTRIAMLGGALLLQLSFILDNCDGNLARLKSLQSKFGMWYDTTADLIVDFALWIGLAAGAMARAVSSPVIVLLAVLACAGSALNFIRVAFQRSLPAEKAGRPDTPPKGRAAGVLERLSDDGDPTLFVWVMALLGFPGWFLFGGCLYINALWIYSVRLSR